MHRRRWSWGSCSGCALDTNKFHSIDTHDDGGKWFIHLLNVPKVKINHRLCLSLSSKHTQVKQAVNDNHLIVWWRLLMLSKNISEHFSRLPFHLAATIFFSHFPTFSRFSRRCCDGTAIRRTYNFHIFFFVVARSRPSPPSFSCEFLLPKTFRIM